MWAYYNEIDPSLVSWLRYLITAGVLPDGVVDSRSISEVDPVDLVGFNQCHFFAGLGGWAYALTLSGWDSGLEVWTGSCPCQPFSAAGNNKGFEDERHLWPDFHRLIKERKPPTIFGEQVASKSGLGWWDLVSTDLENESYSVAAADLCAAGVGAPHIRQRLYWVAHSERDKQPRKEPRRGEVRRVGGFQQPVPWDTPWQSALSRFRVVGDGLPRNVAGTDAARNAIVPQVAEVFVRSYMEIVNK